MIARKVLGLVAAASAMAAAAGVLVVALAYALFAAARDLMGLSPAASAALVAGAAALLLAICALIAALAAGAGPKTRQPSLAEKAKDFVRERPIVAAIGALAAGVVAIRNPSLLTAIVLSFLEGKPSSKKR